MRTTEWVNLVLFSLFIVGSWLRPLARRQRAGIRAIGVIGITLIIAVQYTDVLLSRFTVSVIRDWLTAALMPMMYWQAGRFAGKPNENFQKLLHRLDRETLGGLLRRLAVWRSYRWISAILELAYLSCYELVPLGLGVLYLLHLRRYANEYWLVVLSATYPCYVLTAFLPTRPPRDLEMESVPPRSRKIRTFNLWIMRHISIHLNTFPSAHVTATVGGSLVLLRHTPMVGFAFLLVSIGIILGAVTGRYHYAADVIVAAVLALSVFALDVLFT
jgi:hypothetical protein